MQRQASGLSRVFRGHYGLTARKFGPLARSAACRPIVRLYINPSVPTIIEKAVSDMAFLESSEVVAAIRWRATSCDRFLDAHKIPLKNRGRFTERK
jgi:hypothetical protein